MAVDTLSKRSAALRFGMAHLAGTRPPSGVINSFQRSALLACYSVTTIVFGSPNDGWTFATNETVWTFATNETVWTFATNETVWTFGD
jgi:hypothetical protein